MSRPSATSRYHRLIRAQDLALAASFERSCNIAHTTVRHGSSTPGPLESRRRLAKRHMGDLSMGQWQSSAPYWDITTAVDLTQWQWKPPRPLPLSHEPENTKEASATWLSSLKEAVDVWPFARPSKQQAAVSELFVNHLAYGHESSPVNLIKEGINAMVDDIATEDTTEWGFSKFCEKLQGKILQGHLSGEAACSVVSGIQGDCFGPIESDSRPELAETMNKMVCSLIMAVAQSISSASIDMDYRAWDQLLVCVSRLRHNSIWDFTNVFGCIPDSSLREVSVGITANLNAYLDTLAHGRGEKDSTILRQTGMLASALSRLNAVDHADVFGDVTRHVGTPMDSSPHMDIPRMRFAWLQLMARLPAVNEEMLTEACLTLQASDLAENRPILSEKRICQLFIAFLHRQALFEDLAEAYDLTQTGVRSKSPHGFFMDFSAFFWRESQPENIVALGRFIQSLGRHEDVAALMTGLGGIIETEVTPLLKLTASMNHAQLALSIFELYTESPRHDDTSFWASQDATNLLHLVIDHPNMRQQELFGTLESTTPQLEEGQEQLQPSELDELLLKMTRYLEAIGRSSRLSKRAKFRMAEKSYRHIRERGGEISSDFAQCILQIITADLRDGEFGRSSRIRWFLHILHRRAGEDPTLKTALAITKWRKANGWRKDRFEGLSNLGSSEVPLTPTGDLLRF